MNGAADDDGIGGDWPRALCERLRAAGFGGSIADDRASRAAMSTDNSVFQISPDLVVAPFDEADLSRLLALLAEEPFVHVPVTGRGGGTGTNGQSLNSGIVVDFRRHMTRVLAIDVENATVDVEPGVVLEELNQALAATGLFFAPNTSTSNRCTIGGMISTDASGKGSRIYGKTSDNVIGLRMMLADGTILDSLAPEPSGPSALFDALDRASGDGRAALLGTVPELSRRFTGYDLERMPPGTAARQWWRLPIGAEGTLGLITRARLKLTPRPRHSVVTVIAFDTFRNALSAARDLMAFEPLAVETLDEWVQRLAEEAGLFSGLPAGMRAVVGDRGVTNFVEFAGDDPATLADRAAALSHAAVALPGYLGHYTADHAGEIEQLWAVRAQSVGLLGRAQSSRRPVAFVEDCVVPPENLAAFVDDFVRLLDRHGLACGMYGHVDVGCLHLRPALDMDDAGDRALLLEVSDGVYALTRMYGGIFWGEHGKGIRSQYLEDFVGPEAYAAFRAIKRTFDPDDRMNPGKIATSARPLRTIAATPLRRMNAAPGDLLANAFRCNGNALCLSYAASVPMCPSFKATRDPRHSPKGRAEALRAWHEARASGTGVAELEEDVFAALDGCLGCKACTTTCPVHVDIPEMKSHFLEAYHASRRRPLADRLAILLEARAGLVDKLRSLARLAQKAGLADLLGRMFGFRDLPLLSRRSARSLGYPLVGAAAAADRTWPDRTVLVVQDSFTSLFDTETLADVCAALSTCGFSPVLLDLVAGGKAAHVKGDRRAFAAQARRLADALRRAASSGLPMIGIDAAFVLMLRSEYRHAGIGDMPDVELLQEFLSRMLPMVAPSPPRPHSGPPAAVMLHCTERTLAPKAAAQWTSVFEHLGIAAEIVPAGCCGMAGLFGHEARNQIVSKTLFDLSWRPVVERRPTVFASGFSCRCQVGRMHGSASAHPASLVRASPDGTPRSGAATGASAPA